MNYEYALVDIQSVELHTKAAEGWHVVPVLSKGRNAIPDRILMEREVKPTTPQFEMINGGELKVGDRCIIEVEVTGRTVSGNVRVRHSGMDQPWQMGDQELWTWGGDYGSGKGNKDIKRIIT